MNLENVEQQHFYKKTSLLIDAFIYSRYFTNNSLTKRKKMQHFQLILIVIGVIAICAVLVHGYIVGRKEKNPVADDLSEGEDLLSAETDGDCQDGILGDVRIIQPYSDDKDENCDFSNTDEIEDINFDADFSDQDPGFEEIAEPFTLDNESSVSDEVETITDNSQSEPKFASEFENEQVEHKQQPVQEKQDHFVFNVAAKEGKAVRGHELLQFFLTAGFRFGEMSIFHRHQYSDGTGPVLFSIANMMKPGVFDPENMEQFHSEGVTFFLTAPNNEINIKEAFDMMVVAVEQMAEEFDCVVLNGARKPLTKEQYIDYHKRLSYYI